jgi:membrane protein DedA with SNARE-associated domain
VAFVVATISKLGYSGIVALMALESACIPIPSEIIIAGYLASTGRFNVILAAIAGGVGCNIGSTVACAVGAYGGRPSIEKWGPTSCLVEANSNASTISSGASGRLRSSSIDFCPSSGLSSLFRPASPGCRSGVPALFVSRIAAMVLLAYVGVVLGEAWDTTPWLHALMHFADIAIACLVVLGIVWHVGRVRRVASGVQRRRPADGRA